MKTPDGAGLGRLPRKIPKGMQNTLLSVALCGGLIVGYYYFSAKKPVPPDTHITFQHGPCLAPDTCRAFAIDVLATGDVIYQADGRAWRYHISPYAVRRILGAFKRVRFFDHSVSGYPVDPRAPVCQLILSASYQKTAIAYPCGLDRPELVLPLRALDGSTRYIDLVLHFDTTAAQLHLAPYSPLADGPVRAYRGN